jgi:glycosyltransferase involved in cell wall biosynthesis
MTFNIGWIRKLTMAKNLGLMLSIIVPIGDFERDKVNLLEIVSGLKAIKNRHTVTFEVIFVLDNQKDNSRKLLQQFIGDEKDFIILLVNCGNPGGARNAGIMNSSGNWMCFWDSDDTPNVLSLAQINFETSADIIICGFRVFNSGSFRVFTPSNSMIENLRIPGLWRYIFHKTYLSNRIFPELRIAEDQVFLAHVFSTKPNIDISPVVIYNYCQNTPNSLTKKFPKQDLSKALNQLSELAKICNVSEVNYLNFQVLLTSFLRGGWRLKFQALRLFSMKLITGKITPKLIAVKVGFGGK